MVDKAQASVWKLRGVWRRACKLCELKIKFGIGNRDILIMVAARFFCSGVIIIIIIINYLSGWEKNDMITANYN